MNLKKHALALAIKYVIIATVTLSILSFFNVQTGWILFVTLLLVVASYIIGDLIIYPKFGHVAAGIADFGFYLIALWIISFSFVDRSIVSFYNAAFATIFITFVEILYHEFVIARILGMKKTGTPMFKQTHFSTEFSEEIDVRNKDREKE